MTCIVGVVDEGRVFIGADSMAGNTATYLVTPRVQPKVFRNGEMLIGYTTSFRMGQLLQYSFKPPVRRQDQDVSEFFCVDVVNALRDCFKEAGFAGKQNEREEGGVFLVGYEGRLFVIESDYQVGEYAEYMAVGCGESLAIGSLASTVGRKGADRATKALEAAAKHCAFVCGPFVVMEK